MLSKPEGGIELKKIVSFIQDFVFVNLNIIVREPGCDIQMEDKTLI